MVWRFGSAWFKLGIGLIHLESCLTNSNLLSHLSTLRERERGQGVTSLLSRVWFGWGLNSISLMWTMLNRLSQNRTIVDSYITVYWHTYETKWASYKLIVSPIYIFVIGNAHIEYSINDNESSLVPLTLNQMPMFITMPIFSFKTLDFKH